MIWPQCQEQHLHSPAKGLCTLANVSRWDLLICSWELPEKESTNTTLLPGFINCWHFLELLGITQPLTQHEPGWRTQQSLEDLPGWSQISSMCPPESFAGLASGILSNGHVPTLAPNSTSAPQGWKAPSASEATVWDTLGSWGTWGTPWLPPGHRCQCWEDWAQL